MTSGGSFQDEFFERYDAYLRNRAAIYAHLWSKSSEDVLHDAYVIIKDKHWVRLEGQLRSGESTELQVRAYIDRTMVTTTKNAWKAERGRSQREVALPIGSDAAYPGASVEETVIYKDQLKLFEECIDELSLPRQKVIRAWLSGLSGEEAAKSLGMNPGDYRSTLHKARTQAMRLFVKKTGGELAS